ncbi:B-cell receptor CD22-like [Engystomops pustulosus]|uniref:B-cell receptor CD22-like n=1 Tax=Engystomops pustulosus TaxID=76066 RepID=UPI003AFA5850
MEALQQLYLLLICQGFYLGSVCQRWTFPSRITALLGSCVEIPCTYHPARTSDTSGTVWYLYRYTEILNTEDSSAVIKEYRGRTSLVPGDKSCTLRIDPVTREDTGYYYPGIDRNVYDGPYEILRLYVTDKVDMKLLVSDIMTEGEATTIRCTAYHTCGSSPPDLQWSKPGHVINKSLDLKYGLWREESTLTYIPSYEDDGSAIECKVQHHNNVFDVTSRILNMTYAPKNVTITVIGMDEVMEGSDVMFQCKSVSKPEVSEYEWYKGETRLPDRGREMTVRSVTRDMEPYSCAARNTVGRGESAPIHILVIHLPKNVTITVIGMDEVTEGSDVTLQCNSVSRPDVSEYEWYKGETRLPDRGREMTVRSVTRDMEPYSCAARNTVGRGESAPIHILVIHLPKNVAITVIGMDEVTEGSDVTLQCNSVSRPDVSEYEWYKGETRLPDRGREMAVRNVTRDMEPYSCAARNTVGRGESAPIQIPVIYGGSGISKILLPVVIVVVCLLPLSLLVYFCWRKRVRKKKSDETETSPDAIYTDLVKADIGNVYDQLEGHFVIVVQRTNSIN